MSNPLDSLDPAWAWAPYKPDNARPWSLRWAAHLYRRAAFGATWDQLQRAVAEGPSRTIDKLLRPGDDRPAADRFEPRPPSLVRLPGRNAMHGQAVRAPQAERVPALGVGAADVAGIADHEHRPGGTA